MALQMANSQTTSFLDASMYSLFSMASYNKDYYDKSYYTYLFTSYI